MFSDSRSTKSFQMTAINGAKLYINNTYRPIWVIFDSYVSIKFLLNLLKEVCQRHFSSCLLFPSSCFCCACVYPVLSVHYFMLFCVQCIQRLLSMYLAPNCIHRLLFSFLHILGSTAY